MFNKCYNNIILASTLLLCLIALPVSQADLMCYVCDDCEVLPQNAPLLSCNEDFFNSGGSTEASTVTTTTTPLTTTVSESTSPMETSTTISSTTEYSTTEPSPTTTEEITSSSEQTTVTTDEPVPTPNTAGPVETTTGVPQPPEEDLDAVKATGVNSTRLVQISEPNSDSPVLAIRQRRAAVDTDYTYHCYTVQKSINGSMITDRGCSRVSTYESVCDQLKVQNNNVQLSSCDPCSMNACNGSSGLQNTMIVTILLAAIAALMQTN